MSDEERLIEEEFLMRANKFYNNAARKLALRKLEGKNTRAIIVPSKPRKIQWDD